MKRVAIISLIALPVILFCVFVIWPPDVFSGARLTLGSLRLPDGQSFSVVQYWNHIDFYSTELQHLSSDGHSESYTLDGDDHKRWSAQIVADGLNRVVTVEGYNHVTVPY